MTPMEKRIAAIEAVILEMLLGNGETGHDRWALMEILEDARKEYDNETEDQTETT